MSLLDELKEYKELLDNGIITYEEFELKKQEILNGDRLKEKIFNNKSNDVLVWITAFIPIIGTLFDFGAILFFIVNTILCYIDEENLKKSGYDTSKLGSNWLIPVYLYRRSKMLNHSMAYMIIWCICYGLSFFTIFETIYYYY